MDGGGHGGGHGGDGPMMGSGRGEQIHPTGKLKRCDEQMILAVRSFHPINCMALFPGLMFGVPGLMLVLSPFFPANSVDIVGRLLAFALGLPFVGLGAAILFQVLGPVSLSINIPARTYQQRMGWPPLGKVIEGDFEEFAHLSLRTHGNWGGRTLLLNWRNGGREPYALYTASREKACQRGQEVSALLGLPFNNDESKRI